MYTNTVSQCRGRLLDRTFPCESVASVARLTAFLAFEIHLFYCGATAVLKAVNFCVYAKDYDCFLNEDDTLMHPRKFEESGSLHCD